LSAARWAAFRFRVLPFLPWTILFDEGSRFASTFDEHKIGRTTVGGRANTGLASFCSTPHRAKHDESRDFLNKPVMIEVEQTHKGRAEQFMPLTIRAFPFGGRHAGCSSRSGTEARAGREGFGDCNLSDLYGDLRAVSTTAAASRLGWLRLTLSGDHCSERETPALGRKN
jgi:hypothetical protein